MRIMLTIALCFVVACGSVSQERMSELKVGMSREDVDDILDTPKRATILDEGVEYLEYELDTGKSHGACLALTVVLTLGILAPACYLNDTEMNVVVMKNGAVAQYGQKVNFTKEYVDRHQYDYNINQNIKYEDVTKR